MRKYLAILVWPFIFSCSNTEVENIKDQEVISSNEMVEKEVDQRIISLNGAATEILLNLGVRDEIVGVDVTSSNMISATNLGHTSRIAVEGIVDLNPSLIVYKKGELSAQLIAQLEDLNIELLELNPEYTIQSLNNTIAKVASSVHADENAKGLFLDEVALTKEIEQKESPKVVFIYARGPGSMQMAGSNTAESKVIELAGGVNPFSSFENYKPVTAEAIVKANPDYVLMYNTGYKSIEKSNGLAAIPGMMETKAGKNNGLITMDANLLHNFSISLPKAVEELNKSIQ